MWFCCLSTQLHPLATFLLTKFHCLLHRFFYSLRHHVDDGRTYRVCEMCCFSSEVIMMGLVRRWTVCMYLKGALRELIELFIFPPSVRAYYGKSFTELNLSELMKQSIDFVKFLKIQRVTCPCIKSRTENSNYFGSCQELPEGTRMTENQRLHQFRNNHKLFGIFKNLHRFSGAFWSFQPLYRSKISHPIKYPIICLLHHINSKISPIYSTP